MSRLAGLLAVTLALAAVAVLLLSREAERPRSLADERIADWRDDAAELPEEVVPPLRAPARSLAPTEPAKSQADTSPAGEAAQPPATPAPLCFVDVRREDDDRRLVDAEVEWSRAWSRHETGLLVLELPRSMSAQDGFTARFAAPFAGARNVFFIGAAHDTPDRALVVRLPPGATLAGRVTDAAGVGLAAELLVTESTTQDTSRDRHFSARARAGAGGEFRVLGLPLDRALRVRATAGGTPARAVDLEFRSPAVPTVVDVGTLVLQPAPLARVGVRSTDGVPVVGAQLTVHRRIGSEVVQEEATTNDLGWAELGAHEHEVGIDVSAAGHLGIRVVWPRLAAGATTWLELSPLPRVTITVVDDLGVAVPHAVVDACVTPEPLPEFAPLWIQRIPADAQGHCRLEKLEVGTLEASARLGARRGEGVRIPLVAGMREADVRLVLPRFTGLSVDVRDAGGAPLAAEASAEGEAGGASGRAAAGEPLLVPLVPDVAYRVTVGAQGHAPSTLEGVRARPFETVRREVVLEPAADVEVEILLPDGRPCAGVLVTLSNEQGVERSSVGTTDAQGRTRVRNVGRGRHDVRARWHSVEPLVDVPAVLEDPAVVVSGSQDRFVLRLAASGAGLSLRFEPASEGLAAAASRIVVSLLPDEDDAHALQAGADVLGTLAFPRVPAGRYRLRVQATMRRENEADILRLLRADPEWIEVPASTGVVEREVRLSAD